MKKVTCPHCGQVVEESHLEECRWKMRPSKLSGYRYIVGVLEKDGEKPVRVFHANTKVEALKAVGTAKRNGYPSLGELQEIRLIGLLGVVIERYTKDEEGKWVQQDLTRKDPVEEIS